MKPILLSILLASNVAVGGVLCNTPADCDRKWSDAHEAVEMVTRMRIKYSAGDRAETFYPTTPGRMGGVIMRMSNDDGSKTIGVRLYCYNGVNPRLCDDAKRSGEEVFDLLVDRPQ